MESSQLPHQADELTEKSDAELARLAQIAGIIKITHEIQKLDAEKKKAQSDIEKNKKDIRDITQKVLSFITGLATVGTLAFAIYSFWTNGKEQRRLQKETGWLEFTKQLDAKQLGNNLAIPTTLLTYLDDPDYHVKACSIANQILPSIQQPALFQAVFSKVYTNISSKDLQALFDLAGLMNHNSIVLNTSRIQGMHPLEKQMITDNFSREMDIVDHTITKYLRQHPTASQKTELIIQNVYLLHDTLNNVALSTSQFKNVVVENCLVTNADFGNVHGVENGDWKGTQWWQAKVLSSDLLDLLTKHYAFDPRKVYYGNLDTSGYYYWTHQIKTPKQN